VLGEWFVDGIPADDYNGLLPRVKKLLGCEGVIGYERRTYVYNNSTSYGFDCGIIPRARCAGCSSKKSLAAPALLKSWSQPKTVDADRFLEADGSCAPSSMGRRAEERIAVLVLEG
jgi:hypothetical protein